MPKKSSKHAGFFIIHAGFFIIRAGFFIIRAGFSGKSL